MAYCGKCGTQNPEGGRFCIGCGAPLTNSASNAWATNQPLRESTPRQGATPPRPVKNGMNGGCLKKFILGLIGLVVVLGLLFWAIGSCSDGDEKGGGGDGNKQQFDNQFERIMDKNSVETLIKTKKFEKDNGEVVVRPGRYEGRGFGQPIIIDISVNPEGQIVGKINIEMAGDVIRTCVFAYCGNGIYSMYNGESIYDDPDEYFQAMPDQETVEWHGYITITAHYSGPVPAE